MDVYFQFGDETFVWNAQKAAVNLAQHGVTFEHACEVFADPMLLLEDATADDEPRYLGIGLTKDWKLTCVVHVTREGGIIRIISARLATSHERNSYEDNA